MHTLGVGHAQTAQGFAEGRCKHSLIDLRLQTEVEAGQEVPGSHLTQEIKEGSE